MQIQTIFATVSAIWAFRMDLYEAACEVVGQELRSKTILKTPAPRSAISGLFSYKINLLHHILTVSWRIFIKYTRL